MTAPKETSDFEHCAHCGKKGVQASRNPQRLGEKSCRYCGHGKTPPTQSQAPDPFIAPVDGPSAAIPAEQ